MSNRRVRFQFKAGENVLCFEPDSSKAKVLYEAKVLDTSFSKDRRERKQPAYLIHFQGWNNSWDRVVQESYLLKNNDVNRKLMQKLSSVAATVKSTFKRIHKIDRILRRHFRQRRRSASDAAVGGKGKVRDNAVNQSSSDISDDEVSEENKEMRGKENGGNSDISEDEDAKREGSSSLSDTSSSDAGDSDAGNRSNDEKNDNSSEDFPMDEVTIEPIHLGLSETLKRRLEVDYDFINSKNRLIRLPATPNVISVLESYVKTFAIGVVCAAAAQRRTHCLRSQLHQGPEKSVDLCKETMDGLRLMFDFTLPLILLYDNERAQYRRVINAPFPSSLLAANSPVELKPSMSNDDEVSFHPRYPHPGHSSPIHTTRPTSPPRHPRPTSPLQPPRPTSPLQLPRPSSPFNPKASTTQQEMRLTRHSITSAGSGISTDIPSAQPSMSGPVAKSKGSLRGGLKAKEMKTGSSDKQPTSGRKSEELNLKDKKSNCRRSTRMSANDDPTGVGRSEGVTVSRTSMPGGIKHPGEGGAKAVTSSLPRQRTGSMSSMSSSGETSSMLRAEENSLKAAVMGDILTWRLVPDSVIYSVPEGGPESTENRIPVQPSVIYGAHHLLRMFVELPDILSRMMIPTVFRSHLVKQLEMFIQYMDSHSEELFPETSYMSSTASSSSKSSSSPHKNSSH